MMRYKTGFWIILILCNWHVLKAQPGLEVKHPRRAEQRYEIDAKRMGSDPNSDDALPRSREFIRTDSTYYVGWMYEGLYKVNHAADYLGYKNAIEPLKRALNLIERDYASMLRTRTSDLLTYFPAFRFHYDYTLIAYQLMDCYQNIEQPQLAYDLIRQVQRWNLQREYFLQGYNYLAWTVHRNRFYTRSKYAFLKNSIEENEALAHALLDSAMNKIQRDRRLNETIFQPGYDREEYTSVYHYRAILYSYALQIDSAARYYRLMESSPVFSHNNFGTFLSICGDFRQAAYQYELASVQGGGEKHLQEWAYYNSILDIYKGKPARSIENLRDMIRAVGSTPGYGWYNIGLARAQHYNGDMAAAEKTIDKAAAFKEVHLGTTLGQSHYDFSVNMVKLMNQIAEVQKIKFEHRNWWYNPLTWTSLATETTSKYLLQYLIVNQFALNPERNLVVYRLFSTESTVSWDEIWYLMRDFSTNYFKEKFEAAIREDKRPLIKKYYQLFEARLDMKQGHYQKAVNTLNNLLRDPTIDPEFEQLFLARVYEALANCAAALKDHQAYDQAMYQFYSSFPQLVPFSDQRPNVRLLVQGSSDKGVISSLKKCNINWVGEGSRVPAPLITINFSVAGGKKMLDCRVTDADGKLIIQQENFTYTDAEETGKALAYLIFKINTWKTET